MQGGPLRPLEAAMEGRTRSKGAQGPTGHRQWLLAALRIMQRASSLRQAPWQRWATVHAVTPMRRLGTEVCDRAGLRARCTTGLLPARRWSRVISAVVLR